MDKWSEIKIFKNPNWILIGIYLSGFILYFPSLFNFFSHDDFFHLKISQINSFGQFLNFFNLSNSQSGFGFYRPLTTQVYYWIDLAFFHLNPLPLHIVSFIVFFLVSYLVYKLSNIIGKNKNFALTTTFLYTVSATHFGHLYYLGAFQELGLALFFFLSLYLFILFLNSQKTIYYIFSIISFIAALMSKEFAVTLPPLIVILSIFIKGRSVVLNKRFLLAFSPFLLLLLGYLYLHIFYYGLAQGDSYVWDFSPKIFNTIFWYGLWSFNIPEMFIDYIGPGLKINNNLFSFYSNEVVPILILFLLLILTLITVVIKKIFLREIKLKYLALFICWFLLTLLPVMFLPLHKFSFELTVPILGIFMAISYIISNSRKAIKIFFLFIFVGLSIFTNVLSYKTSWITQGGMAARSVKTYFDERKFKLEDRVVFYDVESDKNLPWSPTKVLSQILSEDNFFYDFYEHRFIVDYQVGYGITSYQDVKSTEKIPSDIFLGY